MDERWVPVSKDSYRDVRIYLHPRASMEAVRRGETDHPSSDSIDLTDFVSQGTHTQFDCNLTLNWNSELFSKTMQPKPNQILEVRLLVTSSPPVFQTLWIGIVESIGSFTLSRGGRSMALIARSRDAQEAWRNTKRVTELFPQMTDLAYIGRKIAASVGMETDEILIPSSAFTTSHTNTQLADMSAWEMLTSLFLPLGWSPFIDCIGRLKVANRQLQGRTPDIVLEDWQVVKITAQRQKPPVSRIRLRWLNPVLVKSVQQGRKLCDYTMTMGWFMPYLKHDIFFSDDKTQRATDTYMVVRQSANSLWVPFLDERYEQLAENEGKISLINIGFYIGIAELIGAKVAASFIPDNVVTGGVFVEGGQTISVGRRIEAGLDAAFMFYMLAVGTGIYEIWGSPFDWIHARNTTEAFDVSAPLWVDTATEIETDFIINEQHAQAVAVQELIYQAWAANKWTATLTDDPRIEYGDVLEFPDGSKMYVEDFSRSIQRGGEATIEVRGFLLGGDVVTGSPTAQIFPAQPPSLVPPGPAGTAPGGPPPAGVGTDHTALVASVKADMAGKGVNVNSVEGSMKCVVNIAHALASEGFGLARKNNPSASNVFDYNGDLVMTSRIMYKSPEGDVGWLVKVFTDSPGTNGPEWAEDGPWPVDQWRPATSTF